MSVYACTNSAPSRKAMTMQDWMSENLHDHITPNIWPHNSPDINPLDYYVFRIVEREINKYPHNMLDFLRVAITRVITHMDKDHLIRACKRFRQRTESVIGAEGDFTE